MFVHFDEISWNKLQASIYKKNMEHDCQWNSYPQQFKLIHFPYQLHKNGWQLFHLYSFQPWVLYIPYSQLLNTTGNVYVRTPIINLNITNMNWEKTYDCTSEKLMHVQRQPHIFWPRFVIRLKTRTNKAK